MKTPKNSSAAPRPIDRLRDSAGGIEVNHPDDDSPITGLVVVDGQMLVVKERSVYRVTLADEIDPDRKNPNIPNTVQRIFRMGSDSELVGRTFLTAQNLFKTTYLPKEVDCDRGLSLTLAITRSLVSMNIVAESLRDEEEKVGAASGVAIGKDRSVIIPDVGVVEADCKGFLQQAGHVQRELLEIVKLFYRDQKFGKWFDSFVKVVSQTSADDDDFLKFLNSALPILRLLREARNCVEHPNENQFVKVTDFFINSDGQLVAPTIEVIHQTSPLGPTSASIFMRQTTDELVTIVESMLGFLCARHVQTFGAMQFSVCILPEEKRQNRNVRLGYAVFDGENVIPAS